MKLMFATLAFALSGLVESAYADKIGVTVEDVGVVDEATVTIDMRAPTCASYRSLALNPATGYQKLFDYRNAYFKDAKPLEAANCSADILNELSIRGAPDQMNESRYLVLIAGMQIQLANAKGQDAIKIAQQWSSRLTRKSIEALSLAANSSNDYLRVHSARTLSVVLDNKNACVSIAVLDGLAGQKDSKGVHNLLVALAAFAPRAHKSNYKLLEDVSAKLSEAGVKGRAMDDLLARMGKTGDYRQTAKGTIESTDGVLCR
jgi:hypothetical protein